MIFVFHSKQKETPLFIPGHFIYLLPLDLVAKPVPNSLPVSEIPKTLGFGYFLVVSKCYAYTINRVLVKRGYTVLHN